MRTPDPASVRVPGPWRHHEVSANGTRLHVAVAGTGALVLLLHGFPGFWWSWRHQLTALAGAGMRAVAVDLRGYGDSDKPPRGYDGWTLAGDVAGLIRSLGEQRAHLVGHGWGGLIAWTVAALHPRLVQSLAVLAAPHPLAMRRALLRDRGQRRASRYLAGFQPPRLPERRLTSHDGALVERFLRDWSGPSWPATEDFAEVARRNRSAIAIPGAAHCAAEYHRWAARSAMRADGLRFARAVDRRIEAPVLQLHGELDPCMLERIARTSQRWTRGEYRYHVLPGIGHFVQQEDPEAASTLLTDFLRDVSC